MGCLGKLLTFEASTANDHYPIPPHIFDDHPSNIPPLPSPNPFRKIKMGLLSFLSPGEAQETDKRAEEVRSGAVAPLRTERQKCYFARDAYFACLDANNIVDALKDEKDAAKKCGAQSKEFEKDCASQWVGCLLSFFAVLGSSGREIAEAEGRRDIYVG